MARLLRMALIQMRVGLQKAENVNHALDLVRKAAAAGANIVCLPECFNSPYGTQFFEEYAESVPGETSSALASVARSTKVWLFGGSIPERRDGRLFNTSLVFSPDGDMVAQYSKIHLFDIDIPGRITFKESTVLSPGNELVTVDVDECRVGLGICYDARFPEMGQLYAQRGCHLLLYPGAFNMTTGPKHWELLARSRANDNQMYVAFCSPARDPDGSYVAWGHSLVVDPWGEVVASADEKEATITAEIDLDRLDEVRQAIPTSKQKRPDVYQPCRSVK